MMYLLFSVNDMSNSGNASPPPPMGMGQGQMPNYGMGPGPGMGMMGMHQGVGMGPRMSHPMMGPPFSQNRPGLLPLPPRPELVAAGHMTGPPPMPDMFMRMPPDANTGSSEDMSKGALLKSLSNYES